jgi:SOS-response transcriptional repressor LexA
MEHEQYKLIVGKRLKQFATFHFESLKKMAEKMGVSPTSLTPYTKGKYLPGQVMIERLRKVGCDIDWLMSRKVTPEEKPTAATRKRKKGEFRNLQAMDVKLFNMEPIKGIIPFFADYDIHSGNTAKDAVVEYINFDKLTPEGSFGVMMLDDSLAGRGLHKGDRVVVNPQAARYKDAIVLVRIDEKLYMRIYQEEDGQVRFESTDPAVEPLVMTSENSYDVMGVAVQQVRLL